MVSITTLCKSDTHIISFPHEVVIFFLRYCILKKRFIVYPLYSCVEVILAHSLDESYSRQS